MKNLVGKKFGRLIVLKFDRRVKNHSYWLCKCECGNTKSIRHDHLVSNKIRSCGCLQKEIIKNLNLSHGMTKSSTHQVWCAMKTRCYNKNNHGYKYYGARGIKICKRWNKFKNFYKDIGEKPKGMSIDRIDNNGNYKPSNCRWATQKEQCRNTRRNHNITFKNKTQCITAWAEEIGINRRTLQHRFNFNWSIKKAFETPSQRKIKS